MIVITIIGQVCYKNRGSHLQRQLKHTLVAALLWPSGATLDSLSCPKTRQHVENRNQHTLNLLNHSDPKKLFPYWESNPDRLDENQES